MLAWLMHMSCSVVFKVCELADPLIYATASANSHEYYICKLILLVLTFALCVLYSTADLVVVAATTWRRLVITHTIVADITKGAVVLQKGM